MDRVAMPRLEKRISPPFSPDEIQDLLLACDRWSAFGTRNDAIVLTPLDTGLRAAECVSSHVADVNMRSVGCAASPGRSRSLALDESPDDDLAPIELVLVSRNASLGMETPATRSAHPPR